MKAVAAALRRAAAAAATVAAVANLRTEMETKILRRTQDPQERGTMLSCMMRCRLRKLGLEKKVLGKELRVKERR